MSPFAFRIFYIIPVCLFFHLIFVGASSRDVEEDAFVVHRKSGVVQCANLTPSATVSAKSRMQCSKQCQQRGVVCFGANYRSTNKSCDIYYTKTSIFRVEPGCEYLRRHPRPCSEASIRPYKLNITVYNNLQNLYIDGQPFTPLPNYVSSFTPDVASYATRPTVIAVKAYSPYSTIHGLLASDSEGHVTDASWKCTDTFYTNWFISAYDDSAWPAAIIMLPQLNESDAFNMDNPTTTPVSTISLRANWIWSVWNPTGIAYCRLRLSTTGDSCCTMPCYNGAACVPYGDTASFTCQCPTGFAGSTCEQQVVNAAASSYQINITSSASLVSFFADGQLYNIPNSASATVMGSLSLNYLPSVIAVVGYRAAGATSFGTLASDSAGYVTDSTWKCTMYYNTGWMMPTFDDSSWPAALTQTANGDEDTSPASVVGIDNRAQWIWAADYVPVARNVAYCRLRLDPEGNACYSYPCKNGGTCTNAGGSFTCSCPVGTVLPTCALMNQTYQLNVTAFEKLLDFYVDGVRWDLVAADMNDWTRESVVNLNFLPTVIAVYAYSFYQVGVLASDSIGMVTNASWKCSKIVHANWMLPSFDDSAWPTPTIYKINGDRKVSVAPVYDISNRAQWIWPTDGLSNGYYGHCRLRLPTVGNACYSSPCKSGGTCTNVGVSYTCNCPAGTVGPVCKLFNYTYELNITANDQWFNIYFDGVEYQVGENFGNKELQYTYDSITADFLPSVIAIYFISDENHGVVASDSAGFVTDTSWKCTKDLYADFMLTSYDDFAWTNSIVVAKINGDRSVGFPPLVPEVQNRASWIMQPNYTTGNYYSYCRVHLPATGNACSSSPCKNGGSCTNSLGGTFACSCPAGTSGPRCLIPSQSYELNITANDQWFNIYFDGVEYQVGENFGNKELQYTYDSITADFLPSVIAIYFISDENHGVVASDSAGFVTDASWKCTKDVYADFMLTSFDDSAWPKSVVVAKINGDRSVGFPPLVPEVHNRAWWIMQANYTAGYYYSYCRVRLPATGNACSSSPCKNGGSCTNALGGTFMCNCPVGTTGPRCLIPSLSYQLNITASSQWYNIYFDGVEYQVGENAGNKGLQYTSDSIKAEFLPSVIAIYYTTSGNHAVLASDSAGLITDSSWKCTKTLYPDFMLPLFNDSAWPSSLVIAKLNGDRDYSTPSVVANIHNRAQWVRQSDVVGTTYGFCRARLSVDGNACFSNPCKNLGTCTNVKGSFSCACPPGLSGPVCINATTNYSLTVTADDNLYDMYLDGIRYDVANWNTKNIAGTVYINFRPRLVAVYGNDIGNLKGFLASDNAGLVTGTGWKCTRYVQPNWMLPSFNDSAWPAALVQGRNGNLTSPFNVQYNSGQPVAGISLNAYWIWTSEPVVASLGYVYCRSPLLY